MVFIHLFHKKVITPLVKITVVILINRTIYKTMGNVEEKNIPKTSTFIHTQIKSNAQIPREKENYPQTLIPKTIAKPLFKA